MRDLDLVSTALDAGEGRPLADLGKSSSACDIRARRLFGRGHARRGFYIGPRYGSRHERDRGFGSSGWPSSVTMYEHPMRANC